MKQKTIATRHLRTKIAAGYVLILFVIFGIVYIWLNEQNRQQELEATTYKIRKQKADNTALKIMSFCSYVRIFRQKNKRTKNR